MMRDWTRVRFGTICIDLDGVILEFVKCAMAGEMGMPKPGAREAIRQFKLAGFEVLVWSSRPFNQRERIAQHLKNCDIEVDGVMANNRPWEAVKPVADLYIDDKGYAFSDWKLDFPDIMQALNKLDEPFTDEDLADHLIASGVPEYVKLGEAFKKGDLPTLKTLHKEEEDGR